MTLAAYPVNRMNLVAVLAALRAMDGRTLDADEAHRRRRLLERLEVLNAKADAERTARFKKHDFVETWFDTGGGKMGGPQILYGQVIAAGPKAVRIRWESGLTNRVTQDSHLVKPARDQEVAREAIAKGA